MSQSEMTIVEEVDEAHERWERERRAEREARALAWGKGIGQLTRDMIQRAVHSDWVWDDWSI